MRPHGGCAGFDGRQRQLVGALSILILGMASAGCRGSTATPAITLTKIPPAARGGPEVLEPIEGRVVGAQAGQRLVVFNHNGVWWTQPEANRPYVSIKPDSTWSGTTHLGTDYAVLLVTGDYRPPALLDALPSPGGAVIAVAVVPGNADAKPNVRTVQFGGYEWTVRAAPSDRGGKNFYDPANVWTDESGALHLRLSKVEDHWTSAQAILTRSLGYGTYEFSVRDVSHLDPAAVLAFYVWDAVAANRNENSREWDVEISQWGDPRAKNARYGIPPHHVDGHTVRFGAPPGALIHTVRWEPGQATFRTVKGFGAHERLVFEHRFTAFVPPVGNEKLRINFYDFQRGPNLLRQGAEIVIERFRFFP